MNNLQKGLIAIGVAVVGYQLYKHSTKPKGTEAKSNVTGKGLSEGVLGYDKVRGKVFKLVGAGFDARWVMLNEKQQPKAMEWYALNGKWVWSKWNGKLDTAQIPHKSLINV